MNRVLPLLVGFGLATAAAQVRAQTTNFTGFYAGVNAGYGLGHEKSDMRRRVGPESSLPDARPADGLPPSASAIASTLNRPTPTRP